MARITSDGWAVLTAYTGAQFVAIDEDGAHDVVNEDAAKVFGWLVYRLGTEVLAGTGGVVSCSGARTWDEQMVTNPGVKFSNHLSGTAIDVADDRLHPYEPRLRREAYTSGYTAAEEAQIDALLTSPEFGGVLQWGHHFPKPYRDPVHFQLAQDLRYLNAGPQVVTLAALHAAAVKVDRLVRRIQTSVGAIPDGFAGPGTLAAVKTWQAAHGLLVDGIFGPASRAAAGWGKSKPTPVARSHGNDVSNHQTVEQWQALKPQFLIAKSTEGLSWQDPAYRPHIGAARSARLPGKQGAYIYVWPEYDAKAACANFLRISGLRKGEWGVIDFEPYSSKSDPATWPAWVCTFATEYRRQRGEWPWLYLNDDMATRLLSRASNAQARLIRQLPLWKAAYASDPGSLHGWERLEAWQYSGTGVDANWRYSEAHPNPTRHDTPAPHRKAAHASSKGPSDMPDTAKHTTWHGNLPLKGGKWRLAPVAEKVYSVAAGPATVVCNASFAIEGLPPDQPVQVRGRVYEKRGGKWRPARSLGARETKTTTGTTFAGVTAIAPNLGNGRRLRFEVMAPADATLTRATADTLIWQD